MNDDVPASGEAKKPDPFRKEYTPLSDEQKEKVAAIKEAAATLHDLMLESNDPRCSAVARTKLEESVMWAVKGVTA